MSPSAPSTSEPQQALLHVLLAPAGQLSSDGQLRELMAERRDRRGPQVPLWYLSPELVQELYLASGGQEAVVAAEDAVITWLQLRFGGRTKTAVLSATQLQERAGALPPQAPQARLALAQG
jgi:hypothetical protein